MNAIKTARKFIASEPDHPDAAILSALVLALESESQFPLGELYRLSMKNFELALGVIGDWRLDRYYTGKAKLLDISLQLKQADDPGA